MPRYPDNGPQASDRSYRRGAVMGLTVAEAFILLAFCLLLLFAWWQIETERKSLMAAEKLGQLTEAEKAEIISGLTDGSFQAARLLREAGLDTSSAQAVQDLATMSRFIREEDMRRLMEAAVELSPETRLSLANAVQLTEEAALRTALVGLQEKTDTVGQVAARIQDAARQQGSLVALLEQRLGESIRAAGGSIDARGMISLPQSVLFDSGQATIKDPEFLLELCNSWLETLRQSGLDLSEVKIEGHASSEGPDSLTPEKVYLYNLDLSQRRAKNALTLCLDGSKEGEARAWARDKLSAIGYSSARLIYRSDGTEDREASRRVMFGVTLNQEQLIEDIKLKVATGNEQMSALGIARIIDGDTIEIEGTSFRLSGIDAPELGQPCVNKEGTGFDCGVVARRGLEAIVAGHEVSCKAETIDRYNRPVALCQVDGRDIAEAMIISGLAIPYLDYSTAYQTQGELAEANKIGIWNTSFEKPWEYRK